MATFHEISINPASFKAGVDMSSTVNTAGCALYRFVSTASTAANSVVPAIGASAPMILGVLQNSPSSGQEAEVRVIGFTFITGRANACNLTPGRLIVCASDGCAEPVTVAGCPVCGKWISPVYTTAGGSIYGEMLLFGLTACPSGTY